MPLRERKEVQALLRHGENLTEGRAALLWSLLIDLVYLALAPVVFLCLLVVSRGFTRPKLRRGLCSKIWSTPLREGSGPSFWIHAVSVGEVLTALPLIEKLRQAYPDWDLRVSVSTFTGLEVAEKRLPGTTVFYFPLDFSPIVARFLRRHRPSVVILMELELWPNFLLGARRRGVPVLVANARITERSASRYRLGGALTRRFFNLVTSFGAQNAAYRDRFLAVGVDPSRVEVLGNLKHDKEPSPVAARGDATRQLLGWSPGDTLVLVAGSTHPGEERHFCAHHGELKSRYSQLRLVLAPRHTERLSAAELSRWGATEPLLRWSTIRQAVSEGRRAEAGSSILVVDTLGELELFYSLADVVFVGGSLVPRGGHNIFEAARLGKPVLFGPHFKNFQEEGDLLIQERAAISVSGVDGLKASLESLLDRPSERMALGTRAREVTQRLRGATDRHMKWIELYLSG